MQGYARGPSYDYNTVRDSENVNGIRDLTQLRDAGCGIRQNLGTDAGLGKKRYLVSAMTEFRDGGFS